MSQLRRIKTLVQASFRRRPPERAEPGARVTPVTLGSTSAVPQFGLTKFDAGGYEIAVANVEGTFYAFSDICTHRRCSLSEGEPTARPSSASATVAASTSRQVKCCGTRETVRPGLAVRVQGDALVVDVPSAN